MWKRTWRARWACVRVSSAPRSSVRRSAGLIWPPRVRPPRGGARVPAGGGGEPLGQSALRAEPALAGQRAERALVVEPARELVADVADQLVERPLVVGQPLRHPHLRVAEPVAAGAVRGVAVGGVGGGGNGGEH